MKNKVVLAASALLSLAVLIFIGCQKISSANNVQQAVVKSYLGNYDTVLVLKQIGSNDTLVWKHDGMLTMVTYEEAADAENESTEATGRSAATTTCSDAFSGSARKTAKLSFATPTAYLGYPTINALRAFLPTDAFMLSLGITNSSPRVANENHKDSVTHSYLYAISRESDNDFHMIIGDSNPVEGNLYNCEASGNPVSTASSYTAINAVRTYLKNYFNLNLCISGYTKFSPAIPVKLLKGSLFFDIDHTAGTVGPTGLRPSTAWELHPISAISF